MRDYNIAELRRQIGYVMQEPVLFNMSIKDNILYGNEAASDLRVRQVAEQANALSFIESNIEELENEELKDQLVSNFRQRLTEHSQAYPNLQVLDEHFANQKLSIDNIKLIADIFDKTDDKFKAALNSDVPSFVALIDQQSIGTEAMRWDDIVVLFEWSSAERVQIQELVRQSRTFDETNKQEINEALEKSAGKFDLKAVT